ncbi:M36 family metallopeptidase [Streptosporangium carneum]|uniref:Peptidase M36 n=1 Tax=Streptosporangium carneum TaxID=47481 RepID=A0A9W6I2B2_9ACTN|nr:M36 family metallopeptidase [Streptosporangium carneum]GLK10741.1 hypothetical protein GCM10017600_41470 [Streptosporangium carneum]
MPTRFWLRSAVAAVGVATMVLPLTTTAGTAQGSESAAGARRAMLLEPLADGPGKPDLDNRRGKVPPPAGLAARSAGPGVEVRWNALGTPAVVTARSGPLAEGLGSDAVGAARAYLKNREDLFGLSAAEVDALEKVAVNPIGSGHAVLLRQRFGGLPAGVDGLVAVGVVGGRVEYVSSSLSRVTAPLPAATISEQRAVEIAARDGGVDLTAVTTRRVTPVAVPAPDGVHRAYQVVLVAPGQKGGPAAYTTHVDAAGGAVLVRDNLVETLKAAAPDNPSWTVFPANPPSDLSSRDTRRRWCFAAGPGCDLVAGGDPATGLAWDVDPATKTSTHTSAGNAVRTFDGRGDTNHEKPGTQGNAPSPARDYTYPWKNSWHESRCDPAVIGRPGGADTEAAIANLHVNLNRMHDWSYRLGFTETAWNMQADNGDRGGLGNDPDMADAQSGTLTRHNNDAAQVNTPDGVSPMTSMGLWGPIGGTWYGPCVDGDYDMSVFGHEYTHSITSRMVGGPDGGWTSWQGGGVSESTGDLFAAEYMYEYGFRPSGDTPYIIGGYVTGGPGHGIRNYDMSNSPLNFSDIGYDLVGRQTHEDGEIWAAAQFDVRAAFLRRYGKGTPAQQRACADGERPVERCPGNRRWVQLAFDALLLTGPGADGFVDERDAILAADRVRFGGANQDIIWRAFAEHGLGEGASGDDPNAEDPTPGFVNPKGDNGFLRLTPEGAAADGAVLRLYVGDYEARALPVADTDPATPLGDTVEMTPGDYRFLVVGDGYGHTRLTARVPAGRTHRLRVPLSRNLASAAAGATAAGDGVNQAKLIDDTEATNWASLTGAPAGKSVVVDLAGDRPVTVRRIQVSAMLRTDWADQDDPGYQDRFTALRSFELLACRAACADPANFRLMYTSRPDAFPADRPRPMSPDMIIRSFRVPATDATHLMLRALTSQCTGNPMYAGQQTSVPEDITDCATASSNRDQIRAAELQAFTH